MLGVQNIKHIIIGFWKIFGNTVIFNNSITPKKYQFGDSYLEPTMVPVCSPLKHLFLLVQSPNKSYLYPLVNVNKKLWKITMLLMGK
jgi:hypothetical protein